MAGSKSVAILVLLGSVLSLTVASAVTTAAANDSLSDNNSSNSATANPAPVVRRRVRIARNTWYHTHGILTDYKREEPPVKKANPGSGTYRGETYYWPTRRDGTRDNVYVAYTTTTRPPTWKEIAERHRTSRINWLNASLRGIPLPRNRKIIDPWKPKKPMGTKDSRAG